MHLHYRKFDIALRHRNWGQRAIWIGWVSITMLCWASSWHMPASWHWESRRLGAAGAARAEGNDAQRQARPESDRLLALGSGNGVLMVRWGRGAHINWNWVGDIVIHPARALPEAISPRHIPPFVSYILPMYCQWPNYSRPAPIDNFGYTFNWAKQRYEQSAFGWQWQVPHWWLIVVPYGIWWLARTIVNACALSGQGHAAGLCPTCGYDLRATPERCPECGTVVQRPGAPGGQPSPGPDPPPASDAPAGTTGGDP